MPTTLERYQPFLLKLTAALHLDLVRGYLVALDPDGIEVAANVLGEVRKVKVTDGAIFGPEYDPDTLAIETRDRLCGAAVGV